ncbi:rhodanese-like domain-containing protein [Thalassovita sp.]|uniref:rhodanese-like domain-containing protein n=1 Tax=Thalassovita sp. TaxID=1979401 RepID=UPI0029DE562A|nr:rhodanese-like domain-containing protein [Thalassovita sp.]
MLTRRTVLTTASAALVVPSFAFASPSTISARTAYDGMTAGQLILIDVRTPQEWQQTGVAKGAWPLDMTHRDFGGWLMAVIQRNPTRQVALICRTGNRTGHLMKVLRQNGINGVLDVTEGMVGGPRGPGWIPTGLPVVSVEQAFQAMPGDLTLS